MGIKEDLLATGLVSADQISGCSREQVDSLAHAIGHSLPKAYEEFLLSMGQGAGRFMAGTDTFWKHLSWLREAAEELIAEKSAAPLPADAFVFYMHQGYEFGYFLLSDGDDPPVYQFASRTAQAKRVTESFSSYLSATLGIFREHFVASRNF